MESVRGFINRNWDPSAVDKIFDQIDPELKQKHKLGDLNVSKLKVIMDSEKYSQRPHGKWQKGIAFEILPVRYIRQGCKY